jgi:hypothetical protein
MKQWREEGNLARDEEDQSPWISLKVRAGADGRVSVFFAPARTGWSRSRIPVLIWFCEL